jgi:hypothetical protein
MDEGVKKNLKDMAERTEARLTESLLRWKYRKEGKEIPTDRSVEAQSRRILDQVHKTLSKRGKNVLNQFRKAVRKKETREEGLD